MQYIHTYILLYTYVHIVDIFLCIYILTCCSSKKNTRKALDAMSCKIGVKAQKLKSSILRRPMSNIRLLATS